MTEDLPPNQIYVDELSKLSAASSTANEILAQVIPSFSSIKANLKKHRGKHRPKLPLSLREIELTESQTQTVKKEKFLITNKSHNKILLFASPKGIEMLSKTSQWHGDGTFHVASKYYYQLYIIHAWINNRMKTAKEIRCDFQFSSTRGKTIEFLFIA